MEDKQTTRTSSRTCRRFLFFGTLEEISGVIKHRSTLAASSDARASLFSQLVTRRGFRFLSVRTKRDVFSHGGCRVFLLDVSHVVKGVRAQQERPEKGRNGGLSILDPPISFSISFYTFVTSSSLSFVSLSFPVLPLFTCLHKRELHSKKEGRKFGVFIAVNQPPFV